MTHLDRRTFLRYGAVGTAAGAGLSLFSPSLKAKPSPKGSFFKAPWTNKLLVIFLRGGNDGTNTAPPIGDNLYAAQRGDIAIPANLALSLGNNLICGLHPALLPLMDLYNQGDLAVIQRVGYGNSSRSHFDAMQHWETAEVSRIIHDGMLGRYLNITAPEGNLLPGAAFATEPQLLMAHPSVNFPQIRDVLQYKLTGTDIQMPLSGIYESALPSSPQKDGHSLLQSIDLVATGTAGFPGNMTGNYPVQGPGSLGHHLRDAAWAFRDSECNIAVVSDTGYDTHVNQGGVTGQHQQLLDNLALCIKAFQKDMADAAIWNQTAIAVISEFGRTDRNDSGGTDHGKAGVMMVAGGAIQGGAYNCDDVSWYNGPSVSPLEIDGALDHHTDFRTIFAELFEQHLQLSPTELDTIIPNWSNIKVNPDTNHQQEFTPLGLL